MINRWLMHVCRFQCGCWPGFARAAFPIATPERARPRAQQRPSVRKCELIPELLCACTLLRPGTGALRGLCSAALFGLLCVLLLAGCDRGLPKGALVMTQTPAEPKRVGNPGDVLDERYPAGSRVVVALPPYQVGRVRVLSKGLIAAGDPVVSPNGQRVLFVGKSTAEGLWQVYEAKPGGGRPKRITAIEGGAMDPAIISSGEVVFSSPVPKAGQIWTTQTPAALYAQGLRAPPRRLTFGATAAVESTVLRDGKILFVSARAVADTNGAPSLALFTVSNDGTEVTAYALNRDGAPWVHRPRELLDGRVGFLAAASEAPLAEVWPEAVLTARPFLSRGRLFSFPASRCQSVEPDGDGGLMACFETRGLTGRSMKGSFAVYHLGPEAKTLGEPLMDDPAWNEIEATPIRLRANPMGHISAMKPATNTGTILCLNVDFTQLRSTNGAPSVRAERVRVLAGGGKLPVSVLGEIPVQADGSFMAKVPADTPLGFEALDAQNHVLHRVPPALWVRAGENRICLGCHAPYNHSPRNRRPMAVNAPCLVLEDPPQKLARRVP